MRDSLNNFNIFLNYRRTRKMDIIDWRVVAVLAPILIAGGWAVFNILAVALGQVQSFLNKNS